MESYVVTGEMLKVIEGFHHRASWRIAGMMAWRVEVGEWEYPRWLMRWKPRGYDR